LTIREKALKEMVRVTKPKGMIVIVVDCTLMTGQVGIGESGGVVPHSLQ